MAVICAIVLILPNQLTLTLAAAPIFAIHSRNAVTAISRPTMMSATSMSTRSNASSTTMAEHTTSLSATLSRNAPILVIML